MKLFFNCNVLLLILGFHLTSLGQSVKGDVIISSSVAYNVRDVMFPDGAMKNSFLFDHQDIYKYSETVVYNGTIDFMVKPRFSVGIAGSLQNLEGKYYRTTYTSVRKNVATRLLWSINKDNNKYEYYSGLRLGISMFTKKIEKYYDEYTKKEQTSTSGDEIMPSAQVLLGCRYLVKPWLACQIEMALGPPYAASFGVAIIPNKVNKHAK